MLCRTDRKENREWRMYFVCLFIIVMYAMCSISLCYNENEISTSEQVNTTTLYPVNITVEDLKHQETNLHHDNIFCKSHHKNENKIHPQTYKEPSMKMDAKQKEQTIEASEEVIKITDDKDGDSSEDGDISVDEKEELTEGTKSNTEAKGIKNEVTTWSLETNYSPVNNGKEPVKFPDEKEKKIVKDEQEKKEVKEFRPSPHLGSFFDEEAFVLTTQATISPWSPAFRKPTGFRSSPLDFHKLNSNKKPMDAPYKFESNVVQRPSHWKYHTGLESNPTVSVPVKIPAGGQYKSREPHKAKPAIESDEEFGLKFKDEPKENSMKKAVNPWKSLLHVVTALLPVGLIVSALTPSIITLQSTDNDPNFPTRFIRKVEGYRRLPHISDECKRRLLCEIHAHNFDHQSTSPPGHRQCYRIQCEDPDAMLQVLRWVLRHPHVDHA